MELIVDFTNLKIRAALSSMSDDTLRDDSRPYLREIDVCELYAVIGLMYFRGLLGQNGRHVNHIFSERSGHPVFCGTMSRCCFSFLVSHLCFDNFETRPERLEKDRFAAFRKLFDLFLVECSQHLTPSEYISLDETLFPMRNQVSFKQYNPDKPAKYWWLFISLNDAPFSYTYHSLVYAGKPKKLPSPFYICGTESYIKELVTSLEKFVSLQGRNISMDRLYTSIPIAKWLLERNITCVGTLQTRRICIPEE